MEYRVEQLAAGAGLSVDTVRFYQGRGLLHPPRRVGRVAWYDDDHLTRLVRIRDLQRRGFTLATIVRVLEGELDEADEALVDALSARPAPAAPQGAPPAGTFDLEVLAERTGVPVALLRSLEREHLLVPQRIGADERYTDDDIGVVAAGLVLLEHGVPLSDLLDVARLHHAATETVARRAVELFADHVRAPQRDGGGGAENPATRLADAYTAMLGAVTTLVTHHFTRTLQRAALDQIEHAAATDELAAARGRAG